MLNKRLAVIVGLCACLLARPAIAGEPLRFKTPAICETEGGSRVKIEPGRYLPEKNWLDLDLKYKSLENDNTRLKAENRVLKKKDNNIIYPLVVVGLGLVVGKFAF